MFWLPWPQNTKRYCAKFVGRTRIDYHVHRKQSSVIVWGTVLSKDLNFLAICARLKWFQYPIFTLKTTFQCLKCAVLAITIFLRCLIDQKGGGLFDVDSLSLVAPIVCHGILVVLQQLQANTRS